ncbi:MAG: hypothetical protein IJK39_03930 [Bacteroidales bacterium]|nr:hypothetical protein [Bacteroidales bacterium]
MKISNLQTTIAEQPPSTTFQAPASFFQGIIHIFPSLSPLHSSYIDYPT